MRPIRLVVLSFLCLACSAPQPKVTLNEGAEMIRFRRFGVASFDGTPADAKLAQAAVRRALASRGMSLVDPAQLEAALAGLKLKKDSQLSMEDCFRLKQATQADAIVFGGVAAQKKGRKTVTIIVLETEDGEAAAHGSLEIRPDDKYGIEGAAERLVEALEGAVEVRPPDQEGKE